MAVKPSAAVIKTNTVTDEELEMLMKGIEDEEPKPVSLAPKGDETS